MDEDRGTGRTTAQIKAAPPNAVFLWPAHGSLSYVRDLAKRVGREDLRIISVENFSPEMVAWRNTPVVVDHAAEVRLSARDRDWISHWNARGTRSGSEMQKGPTELSPPALHRFTQ